MSDIAQLAELPVLVIMTILFGIGARWFWGAVNARTDMLVEAALDAERTRCDEQLGELRAHVALLDGRLTDVLARQDTLVAAERQRTEVANERAHRMRDLAIAGGVDRTLVDHTWRNAAPPPPKETPP